MAIENGSSGYQRADKRPVSIFDLPEDFFDSCRPLLSGETESLLSSAPLQPLDDTANVVVEEEEEESVTRNNDIPGTDANGTKIVASLLKRWSCNICKADFDSLQDQRSHFKSDFHRFNVKLSLAGKDIVKEDNFDELISESMSRDFDVSSISGSDDEDNKLAGGSTSCASEGSNTKQKLFITLQSGERVSLWKCFVLKDNEYLSFENDHSIQWQNEIQESCITETGVVDRLRALVHEPRDNSCVRIMLLSSGGHFAGCVFDGSKVIAHKTFHRYVVRAKAGKKQSSKDAGGKSIHSAGASIRRYNELALKKDIQDLISTWKSYFDTSSCVFLHAPSNNRQLFYKGDKPIFSDKRCDVRSIPLTIQRPTFKEAKRLYNLLCELNYEVCKKEKLHSDEKLASHTPSSTDDNLKNEIVDALPSCSNTGISAEQLPSVESKTEVVCTSTPLHEAAKSGNIARVLELLEEGLDPTIKDERGKTPYMLANEKEVRNAFRRFMAGNLDKWDWQSAKVPSALTKEMEESQAAKQAERDAKRKAKAKELKKLRKAREKKALAEAAQSHDSASTVAEKPVKPQSSAVTARSQHGVGASLSKEEELKKKLAEDREKRAAAAERRIAAASTSENIKSTAVPTSGPTSEVVCSCCESSLVGIVPFHRYNYKYCSTTCMHVHREFLEDG